MPTTTGKMQCLACYVGAFSGQSLNQLVNIFTNISFPCQDVSPSTVNTIIDDALGDLCYRNFYNLPIYPGLILHNFTTQLNALNLTYFATTWQNTLAVASMDIVQMGVVLDYSQQQVAFMSPTEICNGVKIAECLKSGIPHGNNYVFQDIKEVLDFYNKYNPLKNSCTGQVYSLDNPILGMCQSGTSQVNMNNLNDAMESIDPQTMAQHQINVWMESHNNDPISIEIGTEIKKLQCLNFGSGGSGLIINIEDLEVYWYFKSKYNTITWEEINSSLEFSLISESTNEGNGSVLEIDPDLYLSCESFYFEPVGPSQNYQSCAVGRIKIDATNTWITPNGSLKWWIAEQEYDNIYFEFPRRTWDGYLISAGKAATICTNAVNEAEDDLELYFKKKFEKPTPEEFKKVFITSLRAILKVHGGRITSSSNYGLVPARNAVYHIFPDICY